MRWFTVALKKITSMVVSVKTNVENNIVRTWHNVKKNVHHSLCDVNVTLYRKLGLNVANALEIFVSYADYNDNLICKISVFILHYTMIRKLKKK